MTAEVKARLDTYADVWAVRARRRRRPARGALALNQTRTHPAAKLRPGCTAMLLRCST